jgi:hypothetical protein
LADDRYHTRLLVILTRFRILHDRSPYRAADNEVCSPVVLAAQPASLSGGTLRVDTGDQVVDAKALVYCQDVYARWLKKSAEERAATMKPLFENLTCEICGGTVTKVSAIEAVCTQNETHRRKLKENVRS